MIRPAHEGDLPDIRRIIVEAFGHDTVHYKLEKKFGVLGGKTWDERKGDEIESFYRSHPDHVLVTESEGMVVGFVSFSCDWDRRMGEIQNNAVDPDFQNRGIGTAQISRALGVLKEMGMEFAEVSTGLGPGYAAARRMYEKCGFEPTIERVTCHLSIT
jgi:N-acetylglutamate synthase-like GNAT family acetyltransferase